MKKQLTVDQLVIGKQYYCNARPLQRMVTFIAIEQTGPLEGMAYVEFKDEGPIVNGYYVSVKTLEEKGS